MNVNLKPNFTSLIESIPDLLNLVTNLNLPSALDSAFASFIIAFKHPEVLIQAIDPIEIFDNTIHIPRFANAEFLSHKIVQMNKFFDQFEQLSSRYRQEFNLLIIHSNDYTKGLSHIKFISFFELIDRVSKMISLFQDILLSEIRYYFTNLRHV